LLSIGYRTLEFTDEYYERTIWDVDGTIILNGNASIGMSSKIVVHGELTLGNNFLITGSSNVVCMNKITFGDFALISWNCQFLDSDFHVIR